MAPFWGHRHAFAWFGGIVQRVIIDNTEHKRSPPRPNSRITTQPAQKFAYQDLHS
jgi:hypothetical protein